MWLRGYRAYLRSVLLSWTGVRVIGKEHYRRFTYNKERPFGPLYPYIPRTRSAPAGDKPSTVESEVSGSMLRSFWLPWEDTTVNPSTADSRLDIPEN